MSDAELFYGIVRDRLRSRAMWGGLILCASLLVPYEVVGDRPQFLFQLFAELPPSAVVAGLSSLLAGMVILLARWRMRRLGSLACCVLAVMLTVFVVRKLGAEAAAWSLLPLPESFAGRAASGLLSMASAAASAALSARQETRRSARVLLAAAAVSVLWFFLSPQAGQAPAMTVIYHLMSIGYMPSIGYQLGALTLATVALWPGLMVLLAAAQYRWPSRAPVPPVSLLALFGFPVLLLLLLTMMSMRNNVGSALFGAVFASLDIAATLLLLAASLEALGQLGWDGDGEGQLLEPAGWPLPRAAAAGAVALVVLGAAQWWLARPPAKGVHWPLRRATATADALFGEGVVGWSDARWSWDMQVRRDSSASALLRVKNESEKMLTSAAAVDVSLEVRLNELAVAGARLDTSTRTWFRLVGEVNTASQALALPYYLDPRVQLSKSKEGLRRQLLIDSYRVARARSFDVDGGAYTMLHVRSLGKRRGAHNFGLLGFSRDQQPFALVVLDSTDQHLARLVEGARADPPRCELSFDPARDAAMRYCGDVLRKWMGDEPRALTSSVMLVERHELQHQIDGPLLSLAAPVLKQLAGYAEKSKKRVNRELSAYLAELTAQDAKPHYALVVPLQFAVMRDRGSYHHAAMLMFEALVNRPLRGRGGRPDHRALGAAFAELVDLDDDNLRARARMTWSRLFGDALPTVALVHDAQAPRP